MVIFNSITKIFPNGDKVLDQVSFHIRSGEMVIITGRSGAGKTTIGRLLIGDLRPSAGDILVDGESIIAKKPKNLTSLRRKIGTVFQDYKIIPDKTVYENIALNLEVAGFPKKDVHRKIKRILEVVGIPSKTHLFPSQLSGGELQRASLARAIATEPHILFADEPTGNLDKITAAGIFKLLRKINQTGTTVIIATHSEDPLGFKDIHRINLDQGKITKDSHPSKNKKLKSSTERPPKSYRKTNIKPKKSKK